MERNYGERTIKQLKEALKKRNAKLSGRKRELVARLEDYDRNENFGNQDVDQAAYNMTLPDRASYIDINTSSNLPTVTKAEVNNYLHLYSTKLGTKAQDMYNAKFIRSIRHAKQDQDYFVTARISAEMSKSCVYVVDVKLDDCGIVQECQCECGAGMGPEAHCKHVQLVLLALTFAQSGILTKETCTQLLQTFHQVKQYSGSPVKMQDLKLRGGVTPALVHLDPRPQEFRGKPEFVDHFRNVMINCRTPDLPIRHLFAPANIRAVCHDHNYLQQTPEEAFLHSMKVASISAEEAQLVEQKTRGQSTNKHWKQERCHRIHASNYGRICKATDRTNRVKLAVTLSSCTDINSKAINHGRKYESVAIAQYSAETNNDVIASGIQVSTALPYLGCSPDGLVDSEGIIEVKCPYTSKDNDISPATVPYLCLKDAGLVLKKEHDYYHQIQGTLYCTQREWCDLVVWTHKDMKIIRIQMDTDFVPDMLAKLKIFYDRYFKVVLLDKFLYKNTDKYCF